MASINPFRSTVLRAAAYVPGEQPADRTYVKLNTNENPYPPSPKVLDALRGAIDERLRLYPDPTSRALRRKAAEVYGVPVEGVLAGNGSDDLLSILVRACVDPSSAGEIAYAMPTYSLYDTLVALHGAVPKRVPYPRDFALPVDALVAANAKVVVVCNPNSPSGTFTSVATLAALAERVHGLLVVDEAYVDFATESAIGLTRSHPNVVVMRTMSKSFSLAGMRVGLCFARPEVITELDKVRDSYNLDRLAAIAGAAALDDLPWMQANVARIRATRAALTRDLQALGFDVMPSEANFVLARRPGIADAGPLYRALKDRGVLVRHFATSELRDALRITVGTPEEHAALIDALRAALAG